MAPVGLRLQREKRLALATCNGLLARACDELDTLLGRGAGGGLAIEEIEDLTPLALRVVKLRARRHRLESELAAIHAEWAV